MNQRLREALNMWPVWAIVLAALLGLFVFVITLSPEAVAQEPATGAVYYSNRTPKPVQPVAKTKVYTRGTIGQKDVRLKTVDTPKASTTTGWVGSEYVRIKTKKKDD